MDLNALLKRGLRNLIAKRESSCGPFTDELSAAATDLYVKFKSSAGLISMVISDDMNPDELLKKAGIAPGDVQQEFREMACQLSSKLNLLHILVCVISFLVMPYPPLDFFLQKY